MLGPFVMCVGSFLAFQTTYYLNGHHLIAGELELVWGLAWLWPSIGMGVMGMYSWWLITIGLVWGVVELVLAAIAGAYLYREQSV